MPSGKLTFGQARDRSRVVIDTICQCYAAAHVACYITSLHSKETHHRFYFRALWSFIYFMTTGSSF